MCFIRNEDFSPYSHEIAPYRNPYSTDRAAGNAAISDNDVIEMQNRERLSERASQYAAPRSQPEQHYDVPATRHYDVPRHGGSLIDAESQGYPASNLMPDAQSGFSNPAYEPQQPIYSRPQKLSRRGEREEEEQDDDSTLHYSQLPELPNRTSADATTFNY